MFDLESSVQNWRREIESSCNGNRTALDELEDHVREEYRSLLRAGRSEQEAWAAAVIRLGDPAAIRREFAKVESLPMFDRAAFGVLLVGAAATVLGLIGALLVYGRNVVQQPLLAVHVASITIGYLAGLYAAAVAGYCIVRNWLSSGPLMARNTLAQRTLQVLSIVTVVFTIAGFLLGAMWASRVKGQPFTMDSREIGAIVVAVSFLGVAIAARRNAISSNALLAIAIAAGATIFAAWFGAAAHLNSYPTFLTVATLLGLGVTLGLAALSLKARREQLT